MFTLKRISKESIPEALQKAERYRLLNEPRLAESICQDILAVEQDNHDAIISMILSITEQFGKYTSVDINKPFQLIPLLTSEYERYYFSGIISERRGMDVLSRDLTGAHFTAYEWLADAMADYEKAEAIRPPNNDDALLRWNTCARIIMLNHLKPRDEERSPEQPLE